MLNNFFDRNPYILIGLLLAITVLRNIGNGNHPFHLFWVPVLFLAFFVLVGHAIMRWADSKNVDPEEIAKFAAENGLNED